jgi:iron complex transport system ATP-binding protein
VTPLLETRDLAVNRGARGVVTGVTLSLVPGTLLALVGRNGAGKTTLLDALSGLLRPASGQVLLQGRPAAEQPRAHVARLLACLGQAEHPEPELTALEVALMGRAPHLGPWGLPGPADVARARHALERTDAAALAERAMGTLSGGERQRVLLARALCQEGAVLLVDEPTHSLDPGHAFRAMGELRAEAARGASVVAALHDLALAARFADDVAVLDRGTLAARGPWRQSMTPRVLAAAFGVPMEVVEVRGQPVVLLGDTAP